MSAAAIARYKRSGYQSLAGFTAALRRVLPELTEDDAAEAVRTVIVLAGALWTHAHRTADDAPAIAGWTWRA